jgi:VanZ family protein
MASKLFRYWLPVFLYAALIFYFSSLSGSLIPSLFAGFDKVAHFFEYLPLGFLASRALETLTEKNIFLITLGLVFLYGLSDEFHQLFIATRQFSLMDLTFDIIGASAGSYLFIKKWQK